MSKKRPFHGDLLVSGLPYISVIDDTTVMLRDGDLMASFAVEGINADTSDGRFTNELCNAFSRFTAQQRGDVAYYVHRISAETYPEMPPVAGHPFNEEIDRRWQHYLQTVGLRDRVTMITLVIRPPKRITKFLSLLGGNEGASRHEIAARAVRLDQMIATCMVGVSEAKPRRLTVSGGEWLGLLRTLIDGSSGHLIPGKKFVPLADLMASSQITFKGRVFEVDGPLSGRKRYGTMISVKDYPNETYPGILDRLNLPYDTVVTQTFTPIDNIAAQAKISRVRKQMKAAEDAAVSLMAQLEEAEDDVASGRVVFGEHHCTIALFCDSLEQLEEAMAFVTRAMQDAGAAIVRENFAARAIYFSQHPGNFTYRTRPAMISSQNFAEMCALHGLSKGNPPEKSPWGNAVTIIPTARGETFRFNFHLPGKHGQRTVGHSLVLGQTGSGKTLGTAFLISQAQRLGARTIVFDKDNGFEMAIRAMGGAYSAVRMGVDTGFNPMRAEADSRGAAWLTDWLTALAENEGARLNPIQIQAMSDAVQANTQADPRLQNYEQFRSQLRATDDDGDLYNRLGRWDETGQFGWLFGGKGKDPLHFDNRLSAFDLTEIFDNDTIRTAWLSYVFRRIERLFELADAVEAAAGYVEYRAQQRVEFLEFQAESDTLGGKRLEIGFVGLRRDVEIADVARNDADRTRDLLEAMPRFRVDLEETGDATCGDAQRHAVGQAELRSLFGKLFILGHAHAYAHDLVVLGFLLRLGRTRGDTRQILLRIIVHNKYLKYTGNKNRRMRK